MKSKAPKTLAEVLHHLADGGIVSYENPSMFVEPRPVEYRFEEAHGLQARLPEQEWFPVFTNLKLDLEGCTLVPGADQ